VSSIYNFLSGNLATIFGYDLSYLEFFALIASVAGVSLGITGKRITWPWWALSAILYGILFLQWELFASAALQIVFIVAAIFGWFGWGQSGAKPSLHSNRIRVLFLIFALLSWLIVHPWLQGLGAAATTIDTFILVGSVVAQVFMVQQKIEAWPIWIIVNVVATWHYSNQELYFTAVFYAGLVLMAIRGWQQWLKMSQN
jgi:nicotinamide mononucleotide transporter